MVYGLFSAIVVLGAILIANFNIILVFKMSEESGEMYRLGKVLVPIFNIKYSEDVDSDTGSRKIIHRLESEVDDESLTKCFSKYNVKLRRRENLKKEELEEQLKAIKKEVEAYEGMIAIFMADGSQKNNEDPYLWCFDDEKVYEKDIYTMFDNHKCEGMCGKPGVFVFIRYL